MSHLQVVIFDVDGVLVDSRESNIAIFQAVLEKAGYKKPSRKEVIACVHLDLRATLIQLTGQSDENELVRLGTFMSTKTFRRPDLYTFPANLRTILMQLRTNYKLAIVTNRFSRDLNEVLDAVNLRQQFDVVITREAYDKPKPHPEGLLLAVKKLNIDPHQAVYIGDTYVDIEAAQAVGMKSIYLAQTHPLGADININTFSEIPHAISEIENRT